MTTKYPKNKWTIEEEDFIKQNFEQMTVREIAPLVKEDLNDVINRILTMINNANGET